MFDKHIINHLFVPIIMVYDLLFDGVPLNH